MDSIQKTTQDEKRKLLNSKSITGTVIDYDLPDGFLDEGSSARESRCHPVGAGMSARFEAAESEAAELVHPSVELA